MDEFQKLNEFKRKALIFAVALKDVYSEEDQRELPNVLYKKLEFSDETLTEDFTCMLYAMMALYIEITEDEVDIIGFIAILIRLAVQKLQGVKK